MKKLLKRLHDRRGETLVETMVAILIFTLSSIMLFSMATSATRLNQTVKDAKAVYEEQLLVVEAQDPATAQTGSGITATVAWGEQSHTSQVELFRSGEEETDFYTYALPREAS